MAPLPHQNSLVQVEEEHTAQFEKPISKLGSKSKVQYICGMFRAIGEGGGGGAWGYKII